MGKFHGWLQKVDFVDRCNDHILVQTILTKSSNKLLMATKPALKLPKKDN